MFSKLPIFHSKQSILILPFFLLITTIYLEGETRKKNSWNNPLIKSTLCLLIFRQNSMIFEGSPNSLTESYFTGKLWLWESYFTGELRLGES